MQVTEKDDEVSWEKYQKSGKMKEENMVLTFIETFTEEFRLFLKMLVGEFIIQKNRKDDILKLIDEIETTLEENDKGVIIIALSILLLEILYDSYYAYNFAPTLKKIIEANKK